MVMTMKSVLDRLYSVILTCLILLSFYQTGRLWFDDISDYNPFSRFSNDYSSTMEDLQPNPSFSYYMTKPQETIIYLSSEDPPFAVLSNTETEPVKVYNKSLDILRKFMQSNSLVEAKELNYNDLWSGDGSIILSYDYLLSDEIISKEIDNNKKINVDEIGGVDLIVIELAQLMNGQAHVFFANTKNNKMIEMTMELEDHLARLYQMSSEEGMSNLVDYFKDKINIEFAYMSSKKSNKDQFKNNIFLRQRNKVFHIFDEVAINKSFISDGIIAQGEFDQYIRGFFNNPNIVQWTNGPNYYYYWDNKMSVKYYDSGVLEYKQIVNNKKAVDINQAYYVSQQLLNDLLSYWKEVYLTDYKVDKSNGKVTLYFNYRLRDYPLIIDHLDELGLRYPIEVVVSGDRVESAKIYMIEQDMRVPIERSIVMDDYVRVLDSLKLEKPIYDIHLGYIISPDSQEASIQWVIETESEVIYEPVILD